MRKQRKSQLNTFGALMFSLICSTSFFATQANAGTCVDPSGGRVNGCESYQGAVLCCTSSPSAANSICAKTPGSVSIIGDPYTFNSPIDQKLVTVAMYSCTAGTTTSGTKSNNNPSLTGQSQQATDGANSAGSMTGNGAPTLGDDGKLHTTQTITVNANDPAPAQQTTASSSTGTPLMLDNANGAFGSEYAPPGAPCGTPPNLKCTPGSSSGNGTGTGSQGSGLSAQTGQPSGQTADQGQTTPPAPAIAGQPDTQSLTAAQTAQNAATQSGKLLDQALNNETAACSGANAGSDGCTLAGNLETKVENNNGTISAAAKQAVADTDPSVQNTTDAQAQAKTATTTLADSQAAMKAVTPTAASSVASGTGGPNGGGNPNAPASPGPDQAKDNAAIKAGSNCENSNNFGMANCKATQTLMTTTQIMVAGGQMAGSATLNTMGQTAQQNLMVNGASQSSIYQSQIDMSKNAAKAQITLGAAQLAMGYLIHSKSNTANTNAKALNDISYTDDCTKTGGPCQIQASLTASGATAGITASNMSTAFNTGNANNKNAAKMNGGTAAVANAATASTEEINANKVRDAAVTEQHTLQQSASTSALTNMITGGQALLSGAFAWRNADAEQNLLNKLNNLPVATAPSADPFNTLSSTGSGTTITGDGTSGASGASALASPMPVPSAPLGNALGDAPNNSIAAAPISPDANGAPPGSNDIPSSGGMGGGAIGTSAAPAGSDADPQAKYADNGKGVAGYESAGFAPGGGGAGKGSGSGDAINPKDLLAAMMDQMNGKKDDPQGQDILAYGRNPASDAPFAPLPKNEDVFGYIHKAYQGLQRKSRVGLN